MTPAESKRLGAAVVPEKVTAFAEIAKYAIASTPGVVIDGRAVHAGGLLKPGDFAKWLAA